MSKSKLTNVYFSHDRDTRNDDKILEMIFYFRKFVKTLDREDLESLAGISCYSIFWSILEYMHRNNFYEKDIELLADNLRIKPEFIEKVLNEHKLFVKESNEYFSERLKKDMTIQNEKSRKAKKAIETRWLISFYDSAYKNEFGITPILDDEEIKNLLDYAENIENFKQILPDILYTLKYIKFDGKTKFEPKSNWLLKDNNLARVYHGEFGALQHKKTTAEKKAEEQARKQAEEEREIFDINNFSGKAEAIEYIIANTKDSFIKQKRLIPPLEQLRKKFDITFKEIEEQKNEI